jgi:predicted NBD/HSP70 family sugar kinase
MKLIEKNGFFESTGGRKADAITFVSSGKIALGLEILKHSYEIVAINLYGEIIKSQQVERDFTNDSDYYAEIGAALNNFTDSLHISSKRILGLGIVLQGVISFDGTRVTYGEILNCTGLTVDEFKRYVHYPCNMVHDAEAAATVELWTNPTIKDAIFFHIRSNLSGALIIDGKFLKGNELKSGVFEHMTIVPDGRPCYCGKKGCVDTYCSLDSLLREGETAEEFFSELRNGTSEYKSRWSEYLDYLSTAINNLHMVIDYDIILGGVLARYLNSNDIDDLHHLIAQKTTFPSKRRFIKCSSCASTPIAKGAALPYVMEYMESVL